jgi:chemotaxis methyl-accepting protein methylase
MGIVKNVMEGVLSYFLERNLGLRFDICTCEKCKAEMLKKLTSAFPPAYLDSDDPQYRTLERELSRKNLSEMFAAINRTIVEVSDNPPHSSEEDKEKALDGLISRIREDRGVDFSGYRRPILKRRIALRLMANKVNSYSEYLSVIAGNPHEYEALFEALTINVSEFFRDPYVWMAIKDIIQEIIERNVQRNEPTVLWSAGCAHGEEPYSLAIMVREINNFKMPVKIYATDIDQYSLNRAKEGVYDSMNTIRNVLKGFFNFNFDKYFSFRDGRYYVCDSLKELVEIKYLDLTASAYIENVDMILCRNVFIYFDKALQEQSVDRFYRSLKPQGYLIVGETESLVPEARLVFKETKSHSRIYQKI